VAVTVASAYGYAGNMIGPGEVAVGFDHERLAVIAVGERLPGHQGVAGDDLFVVPRHGEAK
jgi:hypothetical protein